MRGDEREKKIREAVEEIVHSFLNCMQVLRPDGGERILTIAVKVDNAETGYGDTTHIRITEDLKHGRVTEVLVASFTER